LILKKRNYLIANFVIIIETQLSVSKKVTHKM